MSHHVLIEIIQTKLMVLPCKALSHFSVVAFSIRKKRNPLPRLLAVPERQGRMPNAMQAANRRRHKAKSTKFS
jgi:hypothetical protein